MRVEKAAREVGLPSLVIEQFRLKEASPTIPAEEETLNDMLLEVDWTIRYGFSRPVGMASQVRQGRPRRVAATALFTTCDELESLNNIRFGTTILICDEADQAHDHSIVAACGMFGPTLKKVAFFGNSDNSPVEVVQKELNHLRLQLELTKFRRMICTGIEPMILSTQYHMDPDISAIPTKYFYNRREQDRPIPKVNNAVSTGEYSSRFFAQN